MGLQLMALATVLFPGVRQPLPGGLRHLKSWLRPANRVNTKHSATAAQQHFSLKLKAC